MMKTYRVKHTNNWGRDEYTFRGHALDPNKSYRAIIAYPDGMYGDARVRWTVRSVPINDMGHEYTVCTHEAALEIDVHGLKAMAPIEDMVIVEMLMDGAALTEKNR